MSLSKVVSTCLFFVSMVVACAGSVRAEDPPSGSGSGKIVFASNRDGQYDILVMNSDGTEMTNITNTPDVGEHEPKWSPDGTRIVFIADVANPKRDIYVMEADGSNRRNLTNTPDVNEEYPDWSPDGEWIAYNRAEGSEAVNYIMRADGTGQTQLTSGPGDSVPDWSPDGERVVFSRAMTFGAPTGNWQLFVVDADGTNEHRLTFNGADDYKPCWSSCGEKIAFHSSRVHRDQIFVGDFVINQDGTPELINQRNLTPISGRNSNPTWSPGGNEIAFEKGPAPGIREGNIWRINADESLTQLTDTPGIYDGSPDWGVCASEPTVQCLASYYSQDDTAWCHTTSIAMLLSQYNVMEDYGTHSEPVKPWDLAAVFDLPRWRDVLPFFGGHEQTADTLRKRYGVSLELQFYGRQWWQTEWPQEELTAFWQDLEARITEGRAVLLGFGWPVGHAAVAVACDEENVYFNDPSPTGTVAQFIDGDEPEPGMYRLTREQVSKIATSCIRVGQRWISDPEPQEETSHASIWVDSSQLFFVAPEDNKIKLEFSWTGKSKFGYWYKPFGPLTYDTLSGPRRRIIRELGFAALPEESLGLLATVANCSSREKEFRITLSITRVEDGHVCYEGDTEPFIIRGRSRNFVLSEIEWPSVPLIDRSLGLILGDYLPLAELAADGNSPVGEYVLWLELHSQESLEDWVAIRFNVAEPWQPRRRWPVR